MIAVVRSPAKRMTPVPRGDDQTVVPKVALSKRLGLLYRSGRSKHWVKVKNPKAPAVRREAEEDWRSVRRR